MNQDQEIISSFKTIVEYFAKKSTFEIASQYENLLRESFEDDARNYNHKFSSLMEVYRNSSPEAVIKINFDEDIKHISSKNQYKDGIIYFVDKLKNYAPIILRNFSFSILKAKHNVVMKREKSNQVR